MSTLIQFVIRHWALSLVFVAILIALFIEEAKGKKSIKNNLTPTDAVTLINHEHAIIVDIRSEIKFKEGHIINAINIPALSLTQQMAKLKKYQKRPLLLCADPGQRTQPIEKELKEKGFEKIYALAGGIQAWSNADFPLTTK